MRRAVIAMLLLAAAGRGYASPPPPRPLSGCGVVELKAPAEPVTLYAEPGVQRIAELPGNSLPPLSSPPLLVASATKGGWLRVAYDSAGREGWMEPSRSRPFRSWEEFLPGRRVRILPALKQGLYALRREPVSGAAQRGTLTRGQVVRVVSVREDWIELGSGLWFRWRDGDGRLTVAPETEPQQENGSARPRIFRENR